MLLDKVIRFYTFITDLGVVNNLDVFHHVCLIADNIRTLNYFLLVVP